MKCLKYLFDKQKRAALWRAYNLWLKRPYEVDKLSEEHHKCNSCGTEYTGNYCPRCGQSAKVGRFTFKAAIEQFLDVWGVGNRSFFRTIRDLMLRPGYVIRDYLKGMRSAYFPPFAMFFILATFSLLVEHGINFDSMENAEINDMKETVEKIDKNATLETIDAEKQNQASDEVDPMMEKIMSEILIPINALEKNNPALLTLILLIIGSLPLFFFFRHTPNFPNLYFSEFIVALTYTSNAVIIYDTLGVLINTIIFGIIEILIIFVALKQFSGYRSGYVLLYMTLSGFITIVLIVVIIIVLAGIVAFAANIAKLFGWG